MVLTFILLVGMILVIYGQETGDFETLLVDNGNAIVITEYKGDKHGVEIPNSINGIQVISLGHAKYNAFRNKNLAWVYIPENVRIIEDETFTGNPISQIKIGANVDISPNSFPNDFYTFYIQNGREEGSFVYRDGEWDIPRAQVQYFSLREGSESIDDQIIFIPDKIIPEPEYQYRATDRNAIYDTPPELLKRVSPVYPVFARRTNTQGEVILDVEIFIDGSVGAIEVFKSLQSGYGGMDDAAIEAVRQWEFRPAQKDGKPIACWIKQPIVFTLNETTDRFMSVYEPSPVILKRVQPIYPDSLRALRIQGTVVLDVEIHDDGSIGAIEVFQSLHSGPGGLDEAAIEAVRQWEYHPAQSQGKPIHTWIKQPIRFALE